jgi:hypothetical protein
VLASTVSLSDVKSVNVASGLLHLESANRSSVMLDKFHLNSVSSALMFHLSVILMTTSLVTAEHAKTLMQLLLLVVVSK